MDLSNILSVTGKSGLFRLVSKTAGSFIVESLADGRRFPVFPHNGVATLDNIAIYTVNEEVPLAQVFRNLFRHAGGGPVPMPKDNAGLKALFGEVLPDYDPERVYASNIRKVIAWYNILNEKHLVDLDGETDGSGAADTPDKAPEDMN